MSKFISHCNYCGGYFYFSDYDIQNKPLETINKYKIRNNRNNNYNFNSYQGIGRYEGKSD